MEQPATHAGSAVDNEQLTEQLRAKGVPQETISACSCNQDMRNFLGFLEMAEVETAKNGEPWIVIRMRDASFRPWAWDIVARRTAKLQGILDDYAAIRRVAVTSLEFRYQVGGARVDGNTDLTALPNGAQLDVVSDFRPPASASPAKKPRTELASPRPRDDVLDDIRPTIDHTIDHINARMIHYRNKAAMSGLDSKAIMVETLAAEAWMKAFADREIDAAQEMTNGPPPRPPANPGNAPPPPQGPPPPVSDNSSLPFNQSDCDFGAVMQKLRTMDGPKIDLGFPLSEMEAWVIAETDRAGLASLLIMNRMYCYAHQESVRRGINSAEPGISLIPAPGPTPDQVELAKYRNALTAAKRALTEIRETSDDASARAASGLAKIAEELEGE